VRERVPELGRVLRALDFFAVDLRAVLLRAVVFRAVLLRAVLLRAVLLRAVLLRAVLFFLAAALRGDALRVADFLAVDLRAVDFFAVDLRAVDFFAVDLRAVDFFAVDLRAVDFFAVDLRAVDFFAVDLRAVDFLAVDFRAVDFLAVAFFAVDLRAVLFFALLFFERDALEREVERVAAGTARATSSLSFVVVSFKSSWPIKDLLRRIAHMHDSLPRCFVTCNADGIHHVSRALRETRRHESCCDYAIDVRIPA
jgi:hypothetical protein